MTWHYTTLHYTHIYIYIHMYVYVCIYIYISMWRKEPDWDPGWKRTHSWPQGWCIMVFGPCLSIPAGYKQKTGATAQVLSVPGGLVSCVYTVYLWNCRDGWKPMEISKRFEKTLELGQLKSKPFKISKHPKLPTENHRNIILHQKKTSSVSTPSRYQASSWRYMTCTPRSPRRWSREKRPPRPRWRRAKRTSPGAVTSNDEHSWTKKR